MSESREPLMDRLRAHEIIVCCGSGGVGKTTLSVAIAMDLAMHEEKKVLVLTIDPAKRLATVLGMSDIDEDPVRVPLEKLHSERIVPKGELFAAMLNMKTMWDHTVERYAPTPEAAKKIMGNPFYEGISNAFIGSHEYMAMEALYEFYQQGEYDFVVIDTPPSHNALDFLEAPTRVVDFVSGRLMSWLSRPTRVGWRAMNIAALPLFHIASRLLGTETLDQLISFTKAMEKLYSSIENHAVEIYQLLKSNRTTFVVVTTLDQPAVSEAELFLRQLKKAGMHSAGIIVNRVLPREFLDESAGELAREWKNEESGQRSNGSTAKDRIQVGDAFLFFRQQAMYERQQMKTMVGSGDLVTATVPLSDQGVGGIKDMVEITRHLNMAVRPISL